MKTSLKNLVRGQEDAAPKPPPAPQEAEEARPAKAAATRTNTRQVSGHYPPEVAQTLRLIAVEQDKDVQEILAEALNMLFARYGKPTRVNLVSGRRKKATG
jgi:hypothetical protein